MLVLGGFARATPLTGLSAHLPWRSSSIFSFIKQGYQSLSWDVTLSSSRRGTFQMKVIDRGKCVCHKRHLSLAVSYER